MKTIPNCRSRSLTSMCLPVKDRKPFSIPLVLRSIRMRDWSFFPRNLKRVGEPILFRVRVNGWANGWLIGQGTHSVVMVFMPQYLEYLGFLILAGLLVILLFPGRGFTWFRKAGETLYTTIVRITGKAA